MIDSIRPNKFWFEPLDELPEPSDVTQWLVDGLLVEGGLNLVCANPGAGKSLLAMDLAHAVTHDRPFLGIFKVPQSRVLFIDQDANSPRELNKRILDFGFEAECGFIRMNQQGLRIDVREDVDWLAAECKSSGVRLVVFDALIRLHRQDEYSPQGLAVLRENLQMLTVEGITVVIIHHNSRTGKYRGSSEISAMADSMISLQKFAGPVDRFLITVEKERTFSEGDPFQSIGFIATKVDGKTCLQGVKSNAPLDPTIQLKRRILEFCEKEPRTKTEIRVHVGGDTVKVDAAISQLVEDGPGLSKVKQGKKILYLTVSELPEAEEIEVEDDSEDEAEGEEIACC